MTISISRSRNINMFGELSRANLVLLENASKKNEGCFYELMSCLILCAFKHEAFINHLGYKLISSWDQYERKSHIEKINVIHKELNIVIDKGSRPHQTLRDLFTVRDALAHGKPSLIIQAPHLESGCREELRRKKPLSKWESLCTVSFAKRAYFDTEEIADLLWQEAGFNLHNLRSRGHSYSMG